MSELPRSGVFGLGETVVVVGSYSRALAVLLTQALAGREVARWERDLLDVAYLAGRNYERRVAHDAVSATGVEASAGPLLNGSHVSTADAGRLLGVDRSRVSQLVSTGELPKPVLPGRPNYYLLADVLALKDKRDNP